jgi:hypothetical protein
MNDAEITAIREGAPLPMDAAYRQPMADTPTTRRYLPTCTASPHVLTLTAASGRCHIQSSRNDPVRAALLWQHPHSTATVSCIAAAISLGVSAQEYRWRSGSTNFGRTQRAWQAAQQVCLRVDVLLHAVLMSVHLQPVCRYIAPSTPDVQGPPAACQRRTCSGGAEARQAPLHRHTGQRAHWPHHLVSGTVQHESCCSSAQVANHMLLRTPGPGLGSSVADRCAGCAGGIGRMSKCRGPRALSQTSSPPPMSTRWCTTSTRQMRATRRSSLGGSCLLERVGWRLSMCRWWLNTGAVT